MCTVRVSGLKKPAQKLIDKVIVGNFQGVHSEGVIDKVRKINQIISG